MSEDLQNYAVIVILGCAILLFTGFTFMMICSGIADLRNSKKDNKEKNNDKR